MPEAVIVATARTPDRAGQQGLARRRAAPTTSAASIVDAVLAKVPELDPRAGRGRDLGLRPARRRGRATTSAASPRILAGLDDVPGVTVNRYCSSSLQTIRMAAHAIKAGEGDVFIAGGVETVSRFHERRGRHRPGHNPKFADADGAHQAARPAAASRRGRRRPGSPDVYIAMGQTAENVRRGREASRREEMDEFAARSQQRAVAVAGERVLRAGDHAGHARPTARSSSKDDGPRAGTTVEKLATLKPVFRPDGKVTAGNACPLNDGAAAVVVMSDTKAERARHHAARPHRRQRRVARSTPRSWASARSRRAARRWSAPGMTIDDIDLVEINEAFAAQVDPVGQAPRHPVGEAQRATAARSRSATRSA